MSYEIDLAAHNAAKLRNNLSHFVDTASPSTVIAPNEEPVPGGSPDRTPRADQGHPGLGAQQRLRSADCGRIPANVIDAFDNAHAGNGKKATGQ